MKGHMENAKLRKDGRMNEPKELADYVFERDREEFSLGDTLDIKTGLILASLTFLAIQSGNLINGRLSLAQTLVQGVSMLALVCGGGLAVLEMWPRNYSREATPDEYAEWFVKSNKHREAYPSIEVSMEDRMREARLLAARERVRTNSDINDRKSWCMFGAFYCLIASFGANVATLVMRLF